MTPTQKLQWAILALAAKWENKPEPEYPCANVDNLYDALIEEQEDIDAREEIRGGEVETGLKCEWSHHYESKAVAMKMPDGSWVGWTYWYGGGKYGEPGAVEWMEDAYDLDCHEEAKMVIVRTFKVRETAVG